MTGEALPAVDEPTQYLAVPPATICRWWRSLGRAVVPRPPSPQRSRHLTRSRAWRRQWSLPAQRHADTAGTGRGAALDTGRDLGQQP